MTALNKQTLRSKARSASAGEWIKESGDGWEAICSSDDQANGNFIIAHFEGPDEKANREFAQVANPSTVLALLDENYRLTEERDALRENIGGDNTRAAADIYFQLVEECEIPPGGSLVGYIDDIKERLGNAENHSSELDNALCELLPGTQYMDPPDGGSVTPLEQVRRMVADYRNRIAELESRTVILPNPYPKGYGLAADKYNFALRECADAIRAAGIGVKGE